MHIAIWILAACCLPIAAAGIAALVDRRAGWNRVPFDPEDAEEWTDAAPQGARLARSTETVASEGSTDPFVAP
jgi:hypothetical protein